MDGLWNTASVWSRQAEPLSEAAPSGVLRQRWERRYEWGREAHPRVPLLHIILRLPLGLLVLLIVVLLYVMPTLAEYSAAHALNPWLSVILPGDLAGCAVLIGLLRLPRTGVLTYLLLTSAEALCCASGVPLTAQLVWWVDLVPTLLVLTLVLRMKLRNRPPALA